MFKTLLLVLTLVGCSQAPATYTTATVGTTGGTDMAADLGRALTAWNASDARIHLTVVADPPKADIIVQFGNVSKPTMCGETWNQTVTISPVGVAPEVCTGYDPATIIAHELGHAMSGRVHSPVPGALMGDHGNHLPVEEAITPTDVEFMFGGGAEVP